MKKRGVWLFTVMLWLAGGVQSLLWAQQEPEMILYNGKVVTMDNHEVTSDVGTIAQALAIGDGKILAVGSNQEVRALAGSNTKSYDLKGKMVSPGFGATHDHPQDWNPLNPYIIRKVVTDDIHIERFLEDPPEEQSRKFPQVLKEAVEKAKPGQWVRISLLFGREYRWREEISALLRNEISKAQLDQAAPDNPLIVRAGFVGTLLNQKAIEAIKDHYGAEWDKFVRPILNFSPGPGGIEQRGWCAVCYRYPEQDVIYPPEVLREIYRLGLSWMAGYGVTVNATALYTAGAIRAYDSIDRRGEMAIRFAWAYFWPYRLDFFLDPYMRQFVAAQLGRGSDHFWSVGMTPHMGGNCSKLPGMSPEVKDREAPCGYADPIRSRALYEYVKAGGRLAGDHMAADGEIDIALDIIERASKAAGMTVEEIRAKRHITEHMAMYPRPDQLPRYRELGMMTSGWDFYIWEGRGREILRDYGERGAMQVVPRKSLYEAGIMNSVEIDRPIGYTDLTYFQVLYAGITRKDMFGTTTAPQMALDRRAMLKSATLFGAYSVLHEDVLGSLEPGKWADLIVIDRDYLTVPVDEITKLRVLMTLVGGEVVHLVPSLAREMGMQPTGAQVELGGAAAQW